MQISQQGLLSCKPAVNAKRCIRAHSDRSNQPLYAKIQPVDRSGPTASSIRQVKAYGLGEDVLNSWGDIASLVASETKGNRTPFDDLASKLGTILYADLGGWHLPLRSIHQYLRYGEACIGDFAKAPVSCRNVHNHILTIEECCVLLCS
jgi:hypothetical protein